MCTLIIKEDGDYFDMYLDNPTGTPIMTFAIGDRMKVIDKLESIVLGEKIDLTDITFPRHADGTNDYEDGGKSAAESSVRKPAPATEERAESVEEAALPEAAESEPSNDETAAPSTESTSTAAKQNAALPVLPIVAGGAVLVVLLAVGFCLQSRKERPARSEEVTYSVANIGRLYLWN